ncbi:rod shape-determining protein MreC [Alteromonas sp. KUL49]|uniref:rod shape-determining protein MreC n=1 Tax=Alteromonas sp. KUL49 TaxID=2480798 RepID=UPI00102F1ADB|nr:rod shape-determining protein MreC [Alteromonas sp. KUL49]TAP39238.1 rod shape-determining protein MreC [Alteromonas sp. KUL49]GEA12017.1 cell shape-determining protein MreC [Alteromonas sp. KUL49]
MDTIFTRGPSLNNRLALAIVLSAILIFVDHKLDGFKSTRVYLNSLVSPLQYLANLPSVLLSESADRLTSHQALLDENEELSSEVLVMREKLQRFDSLVEENNRLRNLLNVPVREALRRQAAELMAVDKNPFSQQVLINKGALDGVYLSQPVIDDQGIVGQVMEVGTTNSRVLLVADVTHAIPVRSLRNDIRFIATGSGSLNEMYLEHVPHSVDIEVGDVLVSSGLGEVFPQGYPVATVKSVTRDESRPFAQVSVTPMAKLDRLNHLLLLWLAGEGQDEILDANASEEE